MELNKLLGYFIFEAKKLGRFSRPSAIAKEIIGWTNGEPFLTEKLCQLILAQAYIPEGSEKRVVENLIRLHLLQGSDRSIAEHFQTINASFQVSQHKVPVLLKLEEICWQREVDANDTPAETILLQSGLVVRRGEKLKFANRIYEIVFNREWVAKELDFMADGSVFVSQNSDRPSVKRKRFSFSPKLRKKLAIAGFSTFLMAIFLAVLINYSPLSASYQCNQSIANPEQIIEVLNACNDVLTSNADNLQALQNRGFALLLQWQTDGKTERIEQAIADFDRAAKLAPQDPTVAFYQNYLKTITKCEVSTHNL